MNELDGWGDEWEEKMYDVAEKETSYIALRCGSRAGFRLEFQITNSQKNEKKWKKFNRFQDSEPCSGFREGEGEARKIFGIGGFLFLDTQKFPKISHFGKGTSTIFQIDAPFCSHIQKFSENVIL